VDELTRTVHAVIADTRKRSSSSSRVTSRTDSADAPSIRPNDGDTRSAVANGRGSVTSQLPHPRCVCRRGPANANLRCKP